MLNEELESLKYNVSVSQRIEWLCIKLSSYLTGAGGSGVDFQDFIIYYGGECQLPGTFFRMKNIASIQSYRIFKSRKYLQLHLSATLIASHPNFLI